MMLVQMNNLLRFSRQQRIGEMCFGVTRAIKALVLATIPRMVAHGRVCDIFWRFCAPWVA